VEENEELNEPATFLFYVVFNDRITTYWILSNTDALSLHTFHN